MHNPVTEELDKLIKRLEMLFQVQTHEVVQDLKRIKEMMETPVVIEPIKEITKSEEPKQVKEPIEEITIKSEEAIETKLVIEKDIKELRAEYKEKFQKNPFA
jgi:hypothetical protein